jgi:hypothetical protein
MQANPRYAANTSSLYANFVDPPCEYSVTPYWWWNGKLDGKELARQIDDMVAHRVYSCIMFPFMVPANEPLAVYRSGDGCNPAWGKGLIQVPYHTIVGGARPRVIR